MVFWILCFQLINCFLVVGLLYSFQSKGHALQAATSLIFTVSKFNTPVCIALVVLLYLIIIRCSRYDTSVQTFLFNDTVLIVYEKVTLGWERST